MTNKTKMSNLESFQELSIQISCLDMKLSKILELLNKPEITPEEVVHEVSVKQSPYEDWDENFK
jgi:hypothetical protein